MFFIFLFLAAILFYFPSLQYGFSQDDFIHLYSSRANSLNDVLNFFNPFAIFPDIFFYRPLATQFYFFVTTSLFGLNPLPFHIFAILIHVLNAALFYLIIKSIWKDNLISKTSALFYAVSSVHFLSLYYISAFQQLGKTALIFLAILTFRRYYFLSLVCFIFALLSKETAIILPFLILLIELIKGEDLINDFKTTVFRLIPFLVVSAIYLVIRLAGFQSIFTEGAYEIDLSLFNILQNFKWDLLWIWGLPEIISNAPSLRPDLLLDFFKPFNYGIFILISFSITLISVLLGSFNYLKLLKIFKKQIILGILISVLPIMPTIILKGHNYPHYLDLSLIIFLPLVIYLVKSKKLLLIVMALPFIALQFFSLKLSQETHWTTHRSEVASTYKDLIEKDRQKINHQTTIIFEGQKNQIQQVSFALAQKYAILIWVGGDVKEVKYQTTSVKDDAILVYPITKF